MIKKIISDFRANVNFKNDGEVKLFSELAESIQKFPVIGTAVFVANTHGPQKCVVEFDSLRKAADTCEIADLLILTIQDDTARITFWQAKKCTSSRWSGFSEHGFHLDFQAQFNQWDLLSRRPIVKKTLYFEPLPDILSSFESPSIGSFGVFHERSNQIELSHATAAFISCQSPKGKNPTMCIPGNIVPYAFGSNIGVEVTAKGSLEGFLSALFAFQIGAPVDLTNPTHGWLLGKISLMVPQAHGAIANLKASRIAGDGGAFMGLSVLVVDLTSKS